MRKAGQWALENAHQFKPSLLIMHGSSDRITSAKASQEFAEKVPGDCTFKLWQSLYHEIHNEPEKKQVIDFMISWLEKRT